MSRPERRRVALLAVLAVAALLGRPLAAVPVNGTLGVDSDTLAGVDPGGRVLLFTPNPLESGSSVSHFDSSAFPNLLMEPSVSSGLGFQQLDLTTFQMRDIGWPTGNATMTLRIQDPAGQGFNDPALGAQRIAAMQRAATVWGNQLQSSVEINLDVQFSSLECGDGSGVLAQAGAEFIFESFAGAPVPGTWYPGALAESLSGQNLSLEDVANPDAGDLALTFNSQIDNACLGAGSRYYYGLNGNVPSGQISFIAVALHEMAHGLGFQTFTNSATGAFTMNKPDIYSRFIFDNTQGQTWNQMSQTQRRTSAVNSGRVAWSGNQVRTQAPNFLQSAPALTINSPASIAGVYTVGTAAFGPQLSAVGITGELVAAVDNSGSPGLLCNAVANAAEVAGNIAVVDRGDCNFTVKVKNAQNAGARGVVVVNNVAGAPITMGGTDATVTIPSVLVRQDDGELIKTTLGQAFEPGSLAFSAATFQATEDAGTATITVQRSGGTDGAVSVDYATADGTATAGEDYTAATGTVAFGDGQGGTRTFDVTILDDLAVEGEETVDLELSNPTGGATLGNPASAVLQIEEDDMNPAGFLAFGASTLLVSESVGKAVITIERQGGTVGAVSVDYATGGGTATAGEDYTAVMGTLDFADGEGGSKTFEIDILDDEDEESTETVGLALSNPTGGALLGTPASAMLDIFDDEACQASDTRLCLGQGRFRVEVAWRDFAGGTGPGQVVPLGSDDSGLFFFFSAANWEMLVKVLDGCAITNHFWVFAAATTDVEYTLTVTDTATAQVKQYTNPLGVSSAAITDTSAFATCPGGVSAGATAPVAAAREELRVEKQGLIEKQGICLPSTSLLCLNDNRFSVEIEWRDFAGNTGSGQVDPLQSTDSGLLWFFDAQNLEVLVKVLDGCGINNRVWVFAAATTDVEYTLRVIDTETGAFKDYFNPLGNAAAAITDTEAFVSCP